MLGMLEYEKTSSALSKKLFGSPVPLSETGLMLEESEMLSYHLASGTYGNTENRIMNTLRKLESGAGEVSFKTKAGYLLKLIFPGRNTLKESDPFVYRHPFLIPFFWIYRLLFRSFGARSRIKTEIFAVKKAK